MAVQPRVRMTRSFDQREETYLGNIMGQRPGIRRFGIGEGPAARLGTERRACCVMRNDQRATYVRNQVASRIINMRPAGIASIDFLVVDLRARTSPAKGLEVSSFRCPTPQKRAA
jgi:hypothetical protein